MWRGAIVGLAIAVAASAPAFAALSPWYQSIAEIQRILADPRLGDALTQEAIRSITAPQPDHYEVKTDRCTIAITVVDMPRPAGQPMVAGPRQFDLQFGKASCK